MSAELEKLNRFIADWREPLESQADVLFEARMRDTPPGIHTEIADSLVESLGLTPIGVNWEMLDDAADRDEPRSAVAAFCDALSNNMVFSSTKWLGEGKAAQCYSDFVGSFKHYNRTILTNRLEWGWNPISQATLEWAFIGFDDRKIALLLLTAED
ncbi:hypothetical protein QWY75_10735 [Pontixanthobacter aestiaquae]|uniref:Uncharacterized protein n=1 Tax=Pontixanthobacter aestiaquae TaxID=1509367 RepID=A0A844Z4R9_9SPHN|nr:hypothetical protein [Pontixanthobacter aestiaquae]MDN3646675.1 hypothetical protein [Pontixanthobacter aestiaquae]MXO82342.1 hypothetical protein [Pontixanthobacter aestiaquae]